MIRKPDPGTLFMRINIRVKGQRRDIYTNLEIGTRRRCEMKSQERRNTVISGRRAVGARVSVQVRPECWIILGMRICVCVSINNTLPPASLM